MMDYSEKTALLQNDTNEEHVTTELLETEKRSISPTWRHYIIIPAVFGFMFGGQLSLFVQNEWTQNTIKKDYFPNTTVNFSQCDNLNKSDPDYKNYQTVQQHSAKWQIFYTLAELIPTLIMQLFLPSYTDSYGRKFLLLLTAFGMWVKTIGITLTVFFKVSFEFMIVSNILAGLSGTSFAMFSATFSLVADLTTSKSKRTFGIVFIEATLLFGNVLASYFSGYFIEDINLGYYTTSLIGACFCGLGFLLTIFIPESLHKSQQGKRKSIFVTVKRMTNFYISKEFKGKRGAYILLLFSFACAIVTGINRANMETLYFLGRPFCWDPNKIGIFIMVRTAVQGLIGLVSFKLLQLCMSDTLVAIVSPLSNAASYIIEPFAVTTLTIYSVAVVGLFGFLVVPIIRSLMSSMTTVDKQGAVFAGLAFIEVLSTILANLSQNAIYSLTISFMNGFVFIILAGIAFLNAVLMIVYKCRKQVTDVFEQNVQVETEHLKD